MRKDKKDLLFFWDLVAPSSPASAGGISYIILDTFTDSDGLDISSHVPDIDLVGVGWGDYFYYGDGLTIEGNLLAFDSGEEAHCWIDAGQSDDLVAEVDLTAASAAHTSGANWLIALNHDGSNFIARGYHTAIEFGAGANMTFRIYKSGSLKATSTDDMTWDDGATHRVKETVTGGVITLYIDDVEVVTWTEDGAPPTDTNFMIGSTENSGTGRAADNLAIYAS